MTEFTKENTIIIIGKSPILDDPKIFSKAKTVKAKYHTIGINQAAIIFNTEYLAFVDAPIKLHYNSIHPNTKIITQINHATEKFQGDFLECYVPKDYDKDGPFKDDKYAYCGFTHDMCLSWSVKQGFKNVILMGVADFSHNNTYLKEFDKFVDSRKDFRHSDKMEAKSIKYINEVFTKYINIYTINPESKLNIPRITIDKF